MLCRILSKKFWKKNISKDILEKVNKKLLSHLALVIKGLRLGGGGDSVKKGKFGTKMFFR